MKLGIFTYGSRGDVQPYISLALGLMDRGHEVILAAPENFKDFVEGYGVKFYSLHGDFEKLIYSEEGLKTIASSNSMTYVRFLVKAMHSMTSPLRRDIFEGCKDLEGIIVSNSLAYKCSVVAEKLGVKWAILDVYPPLLMPTKELSPLGFLNIPWLDSLKPSLYKKVLSRMVKKDTNEYRSQLGMSTTDQSMFDVVVKEKVPYLYSFSPELITRPTTWKENYKVIGFLTLPKGTREKHPLDIIPPGLSEWLASGSKPIYVGFSSYPAPNPQLFSQILSEILTTTKNRIVFCAARTEIPNLPVHPNLFVFKYTNLEWLLPKCKLAIIHGGIGTLAAVIKAGIPVVVTSIFGDQPIWGKIIEKKKLGFHIPWAKISARGVLKVIEEAESRFITDNVNRTAERINSEDAVTIAVNELEEHFLSTSVN